MKRYFLAPAPEYNEKLNGMQWEELLCMKNDLQDKIYNVTHPEKLRQMGLTVDKYIKNEGMAPEGTRVGKQCRHEVVSSLMESSELVGEKLFDAYRANWKKKHPHEPYPDRLDLRKTEGKSYIGSLKGYPFSFS